MSTSSNACVNALGGKEIYVEVCIHNISKDNLRRSSEYAKKKADNKCRLYITMRVGLFYEDHFLYIMKRTRRNGIEIGARG